MVEAVPLGRAISRRLRELRDADGVSQETVAAAARLLGLDWSRATVADIERGRRQLSIGELFLLPLIFYHADVWADEYEVARNPDDREAQRVRVGRHRVGLTDLLPAEEGPIVLAGRVHTTTRAMRDFLLPVERRGARLEVERPPSFPVSSVVWDDVPGPWPVKMLRAIRAHYVGMTPPRDQWDWNEDEEFWPALGREAADDATHKAAAVLGVPPFAVALAARARWNGVWGLTGEREHRLAVLLHALAFERNPPTVSKAEYQQWQFRHNQADAAQVGAVLSPSFRRRLQAFRGHLTRELLAELRPLVADLTKKKSKTRRRRR